MYICSRFLSKPSTSAASHPVTCVRNIGVVKVKSARVKRRDTKTVALSAPVKKTSSRKERSNFKNTFADIPHNVSHVVQSVQPEIANKLYSKFCMNVLKTYGFSLDYSNSSKSHSNLCGEWNFPGHQFNVEASCILHSNENIQKIRSNDSLLLKPAPEKTVGILINNVGFKVPTIRKFAHSENPCILLSVFDKTVNWLSEPSEFHWRRLKIRKCLHNQLWDMQVGFTVHKFGTSEVEVPECNLTRGLSLVLFNKAFVSMAPELSVGKLVYEWPAGTAEKRQLKTYYHSTILINTDSGKKDLYDILEEKRRAESKALLISRELQQDLGEEEEAFSIGQYLDYDHNSVMFGSRSSDVFNFSRLYNNLDSPCDLPTRSSVL